MATIKEMLVLHNELADALGVATLASWKQASSKLQTRLDALQSQWNEKMENEMEDTVEPTVKDELEISPDRLAEVETPELTETSEPTEDEAQDASTEAPVEPETTSAIEDEAVAEETAEAVSAEPKRTIGAKIKDLLLDSAGHDYETIVKEVKTEFPNAQTSRRSIASVAADLRRKGVDVPKRTKGKTAE